MQSDVNNIFTPTPVAILAATVNSGVYDIEQGLMLTGTTYPLQATVPMTIGSASIFGEDLGIGSQRLELAVYLGTVFAGGTSLNIAIQGAIDNGGGTFAGLTWVTYAESGAQPLANLLANEKFPMPDIPHRAIAQNLPRFLRLSYIPAGTFTGGTVAFAGMVLQRNDNPVGKYPGGFSVGP